MRTLNGSVLVLCLLASPAALAQPAPAAPAAAQPAAPAPGAAATGEEKTKLEIRDAPDAKLESARAALRVQAGGLTSEQVARRAVATSVTAEAKQAEIEAAAAKVDQAIVQFLPKLNLSATYRRSMRIQNGFGGGGFAMAGVPTEGRTNPNDPTLLTVQPCPQQPGLEGQQCVFDQFGNAAAARPFDFNFDPIVNNYSLEASLSVPLSDYVLRFSNAVKGAQSSEEAARLAKRAEEIKNAHDARIIYYNWTRSVAAGAVTQSSLERTKALLEDARGAFSVGMVTKADVMRLEALVASTEFAITEANTMRGLAEEQLAITMGEPTQEYRVGEDVLAPVPPPANQSKDALVEEAYRNRVELKALQAGVKSFERGIKALHVSRYPRLDAFGTATYANPNQLYFPAEQKWDPSWYVGLSLSYSPNDTLGTNATAKEYKAQLAKMRADEKGLRLGLRMEVAAAELERKKAQANLETSTRGYEAAREAYRVARDLYQVGRATTTDLIAAESELVIAELKQINAAIDARVAATKLEHATGRDVTR